MCTHTCRYGVQVASALLVFILMWILLATLDDGLKDPKHFDPDTKTTFWVGNVSITSFYHRSYFHSYTGSCTDSGYIWIYIHFAVPNICP
jgi:hypothetical protein